MNAAIEIFGETDTLVEYRNALVARLDGYIKAKAPAHPYEVISGFSLFYSEPEVQEVLLTAIDKVERINPQHATDMASFIETNGHQYPVFREEAAKKRNEIEARKIAATPGTIKITPAGYPPRPEKIELLKSNLKRLKECRDETKRSEIEDLCIAAVDSAYRHHSAETIEALEFDLTCLDRGSPRIVAKFYELLGVHFGKSPDDVIDRLAKLSENKRMPRQDDPELNATFQLEKWLRQYAVKSGQSAFKKTIELINTNGQEAVALRGVATAALFDLARWHFSASGQSGCNPDRNSVSAVLRGTHPDLMKEDQQIAIPVPHETGSPLLALD